MIMGYLEMMTLRPMDMELQSMALMELRNNFMTNAINIKGDSLVSIENPMLMMQDGQKMESKDCYSLEFFKLEHLSPLRKSSQFCHLRADR